MLCCVGQYWRFFCVVLCVSVKIACMLKTRQLKPHIAFLASNKTTVRHRGESSKKKKKKKTKIRIAGTTQTTRCSSFFDDEEESKEHDAWPASLRAGVHVAQWAVLSAASLLFANVQVTTRLVSASCPAFYWYMAHLLLHPNQNNSRRYYRYIVQFDHLHCLA